MKKDRRRLYRVGQNDFRLIRGMRCINTHTSLQGVVVQSEANFGLSCIMQTCRLASMIMLYVVMTKISKWRYNVSQLWPVKIGKNHFMLVIENLPIVAYVTM